MEFSFRSICIVFLTVLFSSGSYAQVEQITPLYSNVLLDDRTGITRQKSRGPDDTLQLPFMEDFSIIRHFPDPDKWLDKHVYVNATFPINPTSIGVATFDGLTSDGYAYSPNLPLSYGVADYLTSLPIDLSAVTPDDSLYLSFTYQPQGLGNNPDQAGAAGGDSLVLEFLKNGTWTHVWSINGRSLHPFRHVIIPVKDPDYFTSAFQFRFYNYATLAGSFDHWHLDYVFLDQGRNHADTIFQDFAFIKNPNSLLKNYHEMPWSQYKNHAAQETKDSMVITIRNNYNQITPVGYQYIITDPNGAQVVASSGLSGNVNANSEFTYANKVPAISNGLPTGFPGTAVKFGVTNIISPPADRLRLNDTVRTSQRFDHHFAYDDGTAEAGYSLNAIGAQLAVKFNLNVSEVLTAVAFNWNFANFDMSQAPFRLTVWNDDNGKPGSIILQKDSVWYPVYDAVNGYHIYNLNNSSGSLSGTVYIGWIQVNNDRLNVGFDMNRNHSDKIFYNVDGSWKPSSTLEKGALMIRPIFGTPEFPVDINESPSGEEAPMVLYPNPAQNFVYIGTGEKVAFFRLTDLSGRIVKEGIPAQNNRIGTEGISNGIYLVEVTTDGNRRELLKLVIKN